MYTGEAFRRRHFPVTFILFSHHLPFFFKHQKSPTLGSKAPNSVVPQCMDCHFWCGRCSEPTLNGKKSINCLASSDACFKFAPRGQPKKAQEAQT